MSDGKTVLFVVALAFAGCATPTEDGGTDAGSTGAATSTGAMPSSSTAASTAPASTGAAGSSEATGAPSTGSSSTGAGCADVDPAPNPKDSNCSLIEQDCPACHKCTHAWDGGNEPHPVSVGKVCIPVDLDPVDLGAPCSYGDELGVDNCGENAFCWSPDQTTTDGYCVAFCGPDYVCEDGTICAGGGDGELGCLPACDPFAPECPDATELCLFFDGGAQCLGGGLPEIPTAPGAECSSVCGEGLACVSSEAYGSGCEFGRCCTELCSADQACSDPSQTCFGECGEAPEGLSVCTVPAPPDPEQCPPVDAEPNYPWCSTTAGDCDEAFGGGNDCVDLCFCDVACDVPADCPVPETGNPTVECSEEFSQNSGCMLSCANGETCPDGMYCADDLYPGYCMWFVELEPECTQG